MEKDAQFAFRVEASLRDQFVQTCRGMDRPAGQVLREFMRDYVKENSRTENTRRLSPTTAQGANP